MRVTTTAIIALLTSGVIAAGTQPTNAAACGGCNLSQMSDKNHDCAAHNDPTANLPVRDESEDYTCKMCPPKDTLLKFKKKMSKNPDRSLCKHLLFLIITKY